MTQVFPMLEMKLQAPSALLLLHAKIRKGINLALSLIFGGSLMALAMSACQPRDSSIENPLQIPLPANTDELALHDWTLQPLASFEIRARVISLHSYRSDPTPAGTLAPFDVALGWGPMADENILKRIEITQHDRQYFWRWWGAAPLPEKDLVSHSANIHLIPADDVIAAQIESLQPGQWVHLRGKLVEASHPKAAKAWRSSLSRDDQGEGACEILLLESLQHISGRSRNL